MLGHELIEQSKFLQDSYKRKKPALVAAANFLLVEREKLKNAIHSSMTDEQVKEQSENIAILKYEIASLKHRIKQ